MTSAPANLLAVRRLLLDQLPALDPASVGIVGDPAHRGGYHCGADRVLSEDYSVVESARDRTGLADWACALDVGDFTVTVGGKRHTLASFSVWLVAQCKAGTADTRDIREVIYSPDGVVVRRWDRLGRRTSGDSTHRWHTHISYHRDAIKAGRDQAALFTRYLTYIGLVEAPAPIVEAPDMDATQARQLAEVHAALLNPDQGMDKRHLAQLIKDVAFVLVKGPAAGSSAWVGQALTRIAEASGIDAAELEQISTAAREGAASAADQLVQAVMSRLEGADGYLTYEDVKQAVRDAFAGGLAPETTPQS